MESPVLVKNLAKTILRPVACFEVLESWGVRMVPICAKAMLLKIYNLPGIVQYKALGGLKLLREVCDVLDSLRLTNFVVGGFAYDIAAGRITRYHKDIDVTVVLDGDATPMLESFARHGFQVAPRKSCCQIAKYGRLIDVFYHYPSDDGYVVTRHQEKCVRMPNCCCSYDTKYFWGHAYKVASDEYNICIEPFVFEKDSLEYISRLKQNSPITCRRIEEEVIETVTVYEFRHESGDEEGEKEREPPITATEPNLEFSDFSGP